LQGDKAENVCQTPLAGIWRFAQSNRARVMRVHCVANGFVLQGSAPLMFANR